VVVTGGDSRQATTTDVRAKGNQVYQARRRHGVLAIVIAAMMAIVWIHGPVLTEAPPPEPATVSPRLITLASGLVNARRVIGYAPEDDSELVFADEIRSHLVEPARGA
jgi:hypothetical protein